MNDGVKQVYEMPTSGDLMKFARNARVVFRDANKNNYEQNTYAKYSKDTIVNALKNPSDSEITLRGMSRYLYNISCQYSRLLQYFSNMLLFSYVIIPSGSVDPQKADVEEVRSKYEDVKRKLDNMNMRHEFGKVLNIAFRDDVYYGYIHETKESFTIQQLDPDYCKIIGTEDGVFQFSFNCEYFRSHQNSLPFYPDEIVRAYNAYTDGTGEKWVSLEAKNTICIKINEDSIIPIPPFVSLFSALADIEDYRTISKNASEISNYKALAMMIPTDDEGHPLLSKEVIQDYYQMMSDVVPENIGTFVSPMKVQDFTFEKSGALSDTDIVSRAEDQFWRQAGVNSLIFGAGDDPSSSTIATSIHADEAICFRVLRQIERWVNRQLKYVSGKYKFSVRFLDVTVYNWREVGDAYIKLGQYGIPVRTAISSIYNISPATYENLMWLENDVMRYYESEIPLQSSNTISGEVGHPTNESKGLPLTDRGEESAENE